MATSWVIIRLSDNAAILETWSEKVAKAINTEKYKAVPIMEYLTGLNKKKETK